MESNGKPSMNLSFSNIFSKWQSRTPYFQGLLRIMVAFMFINIGAMKLFAFPTGMPPSGATAEIFSLLGLAGILEFFGGAFFLVGLFTRPVAFILSGLMAVAYFMAHAPRGFWPMLNGGQAAILYCFIFLYFSAAGAGAWSLDKKLKK